MIRLCHSERSEESLARRARLSPALACRCKCRSWPRCHSLRVTY
jgi:hypothetical protein